ncbi:MAG: hypothetical protein PHG36_04870 [Dehalococcoidia bacterium]|nr:hypothetical protein [Dehalococcoidia bacterium]
MLRLSDLNLAEFYCESAHWMPGAEVVQKQDAVYILSPQDFPGCNLVVNLSLESNEAPEEFISRARAFYNGRKKAFVGHLRGHRDQEIIRYCRDNKIFIPREPPGMVLDEPVKDTSMPAGAELHWVDNEKELQAYREVIGEAFESLAFPREATESYFDHAQRVISPHVILAVVYLDKEPAAVALAMLTHGIAGIYWVGTTSKTRGKGLAGYCTREVSNAAFQLGARKVVLQASEFGRPVYLRLGYREFTSYPFIVCSNRQRTDH